MFFLNKFSNFSMKRYTCQAICISRQLLSKNVFKNQFRCYISIPDLFNFQNHELLDRVYNSAHDKNNELPRCKRINGRYISPWDNEKKISSILKWLLNRKRETDSWSFNKKNKIESVSLQKKLLKEQGKVRYVWMGHSSCYLQANGINVLTDPVWSDRCSPSQYFGPKRIMNVPIQLEELDIDIVLLSHTHYDHLDAPSALRIGNRALWLVPLGVKSFLSNIGIYNCVELDWWQSHSIQLAENGPSINVTFTPTRHWTSRTPFDRNVCLWGSFVFKSPDCNFFFSGDTAYCDVFKKIGQLYGPFDIAAIPIGAYKPREFLSSVHCNPMESIQIHKDLKSNKSVAIHWATFPLSDEEVVEPALELARCREIMSISKNDFFTTIPGEIYSYDDSFSRSDFASINSDIYNSYKEHFNHSNLTDISCSK